MPTLSQRVRHIIGDSFGAAIVEETIEKALKDVKERAAKPETIFYDPMSMFMGRDWLNKGNQQANFTDLRAMSTNPIIGAIVQTRLNQVAAFCKPQRMDYDLGYAIISDDEKYNKENKTTRALESWVYSMGLPEYGEPLLETFVRKFMRDSLVMDQACAEVIYRKNGQPAYVVAVDSATIRKLRVTLDYVGQAAKPNEPYYCQVINDRIEASYTQDQMIFAIRNPQTDMGAAGYGMSELEMLIRTVSSIINTEKYNSGQMTQGGTQKGILLVKGDADTEQFNIFKRDFREAVRNAAQHWRPPVLRVGKDADVSWITLDRSNRDMEYAALFEFLVKQACGVYQIDPSEINWSIGQAGTSINYDSNSQVKQMASRERGLKPLLTFLANTINVSLLHKIDPKYRLEFRGFDMDRNEETKIIAQEVSTYRTLNEVRADKNLDPLDGGDIVLNPIFAQASAGAKQTEQQEQQREDQDGGQGNDSNVDISQEMSQ